MDHVALDRTRPDDGDLDDQVVERARLHPRQHRHLGAALDLERAERVGLPDHGVGPRVFRRMVAKSSSIPLASARKVNARFMQVSMPSARQSTFMNFSASMSSLSHSMTW